MADVDDLKTIKAQVLAILKDITTNPKPSYVIDGQAVRWSEYQRMLLSQIQGLNDLIAAEEPFEVITQGYT